MLLKRIRLINFRNFQDRSFDFNNQLIAFVGPNGIGKTNVLDAIYYSCMCKSYLNSADEHVRREGQDFFSLRTEIQEPEELKEVFISHSLQKGKNVRVDNRTLDRLSDHIGNFPVVMIAPNDTDLIRLSSDIRRRFLNGIIAQVDRSYLLALQSHNKLLKNRNALLKANREHRSLNLDVLSVLDQQMAPLMDEIHQKRLAFVAQYTTLLAEAYAEISGEQAEVNLEMLSQLKDLTGVRLLEEQKAIDLNSGKTTKGIHRDDLVFSIKGLSLKRAGSQGQQKSFVIALKLAQYKFLQKKLNKQAFLLLDDIFEKLDKTRMSNLLRLVAENQFGQIFLSDTNPERVSSALKELKAESAIIDLGNPNLR